MITRELRAWVSISTPESSGELQYSGSEGDVNGKVRRAPPDRSPGGFRHRHPHRRRAGDVRGARRSVATARCRRATGRAGGRSRPEQSQHHRRHDAEDDQERAGAPELGDASAAPGHLQQEEREHALNSPKEQRLDRPDAFGPAMNPISRPRASSTRSCRQHLVRQHAPLRRWRRAAGRRAEATRSTMPTTMPALHQRDDQRHVGSLGCRPPAARLVATQRSRPTPNRSARRSTR